MIVGLYHVHGYGRYNPQPWSCIGYDALGGTVIPFLAEVFILN